MTKFSKLTIGLIASSSLFASVNEKDISKLTNIIYQKYTQNPNIQEFKIDVLDSKSLPNLKNEWVGVKLKLSGKFNQAGNLVPFSESQVFFTDGEIFTESLSSLNGSDWNNLFVPQIDPKKHYNQEHLLIGDKNAPNKIVIFSDPLCSYCQRTIPAMLEYVKQFPKTFAVYYYHLPLERIHPASVPLTKLMYMAQVRNDINGVISAYRVPLNPKETDEVKVLEAFNKTTGLKYIQTDLKNQNAEKTIEQDKIIASELDVRGTPTVYLNGEKTGGEFYKTIKPID
jgi:glutaredoxin